MTYLETIRVIKCFFKAVELKYKTNEKLYDFLELMI